MAYIQIARGVFGDLGRNARARAESIAATLELRRQQIAAAEESGSGSLEALRRAAKALETAWADANAAAAAADNTGLDILLLGVALLVLVKFVQAAVANWALERQFIRWRSDPNAVNGLSAARVATASGIMGIVTGFSAFHFAHRMHWKS